jgi:hypothetical protein
MSQRSTIMLPGEQKGSTAYNIGAHNMPCRPVLAAAA